MDTERASSHTTSGTQKVFGFSPAFYNIHETTKMLQIALILKDQGHQVTFFSHGGLFEYLVKNAGILIVSVAPQYTKSDIARMLELSRFENLENMLSKPKLRLHIDAEMTAYKQHQLDLLVTGYNFTSSIAAPAAGVPLVWIVHAPCVSEYYEQRLATFPSQFKNRFTSVLPQQWLDRSLNWLATTNLGLGVINTIAREYHLHPFKNMFSFIRGNLTLLCESPVLTPLKPTNAIPAENFIGPILPNLQNEVSQVVLDHIAAGKSAGRRTVFLAMGCSGQKKMFSSIINYLDSREDLQSVVAYTIILGEDETPVVSDRTLLHQIVFAEQVTAQVDLCIIHGGHGTVYTQAFSGTPFIAIPMQMEQEYNIDMLVSHHGGLQISNKDFNLSKLADAISIIFDDYASYDMHAKSLKEKLPEPQGAANGAQKVLTFINDLNNEMVNIKQF